MPNKEARTALVNAVNGTNCTSMVEAVQRPEKLLAPHGTGAEEAWI